ncbi:MAG: hypothetical protein P1U58_19535 [Verrucomicrobiales bacterium]|nr:hypothetical protein [Verrucomicrobiales bacterium]
MSDTFYSATSSDAEGINLSRFISLLGIAPTTSATFSPNPGAPLESAWKTWQETRFVPHYAPAFIRTFGAAMKLRIETIVSADLALDSELPEAARKKSLSAGRPFLEGKTEMKGHREWIRFAERVEKNQSPGHLCVLFALQSALYHLPLSSALEAFVSFEFQSRSGKFPFAEMTAEENLVFSSVLPRIPLAVRSNSEEIDGESGKLRAI